jgi:hypothetical protein
MGWNPAYLPPMSAQGKCQLSTGESRLRHPFSAKMLQTQSDQRLAEQKKRERGAAGG